MSLFNGGYAIVSANDNDVYSKCVNALANQKPILYYENDTTCYYIDSASIVGTDVVLTKGGKTITIDSSNNVVSSGDVQNHLYKIKFDANYNSNDYVMEFKFIANRDIKSFDELIDNNDLLLYYNRTLLIDITTDLQNNAYIDGVFTKDNNDIVVDIADYDNGSNQWVITNVTLTKLF